MTLVGTRPEIIRLSRVIDRFDKSFEHVLVHTDQNWDPNLSGRFFDEMRIRKPDHHMGVDVSSLGTVMAGVLVGTERIIREERPDAFLVLGDTNSAIGAVMAKRLRVPVYHMEAGNRCFDENVPEETNRRLVDHVADFNCVYTEHARRNLLREGLHPRRVVLTGSPMREVLDHYRADIDASTIVEELGLEEGQFFLVSLHREETVDIPERLGLIMEGLSNLANAYGLPVVVSTHPRTRRRLDEGEYRQDVESVRFLEPFGFFDYNKLQCAARCVLSDSGTISEESAILGFRAITLRASMERPEALETGSIAMADAGSHDLVQAVSHAMESSLEGDVPSEYEIRNTSHRMTQLIESTAPLHCFWSGLR